MRLPKRTKKQRQELRIEAAEHARRVRDGDALDVLRNKNVIVTADPETRAVLLDHQRQTRELARRSGVPEADPTKEPYSCSKHQWHGPRRMLGAPPVPAMFCPFCQAEAAAPKPSGPEVWVDSPPRREIPMSAAAQAAWEQKLLERESAGSPPPNSRAEREALADIDAAREGFEDDLAEREARQKWLREHGVDEIPPRHFTRRTKRDQRRAVAHKIHRSHVEQQGDRLFVHSDPVERRP